MLKYLLLIALLLTSCTRDYHRLQMIQHDVNMNLTYERTAKWELPTDNKGDCKQYAILKQKLLSDMGIKSYLATCYTEKLSPHAVLLADIKDGQFVLDNRHWDTKRFNSLHYMWRSKETDAGWVSIKTGAEVKAPAGYIGGLR